MDEGRLLDYMRLQCTTAYECAASCFESRAHIALQRVSTDAVCQCCQCFSCFTTACNKGPLRTLLVTTHF